MHRAQPARASLSAAHVAVRVAMGLVLLAYLAPAACTTAAAASRFESRARAAAAGAGSGDTDHAAASRSDTLPAASRQAAVRPRPHIVFVMADDVRLPGAASSRPRPLTHWQSRTQAA